MKGYIIVSCLNDRFKLNIEPFINDDQLRFKFYTKLKEDMLNGDTSILQLMSNEQLVEYIN